MSAKGMKRVAADLIIEEPSAKRAADFLKAQGVSKSMYAPVVEIIGHAQAELSEDCRSMLLAILPWSLSVAADERHASQVAAVQMAEGVVEAIQARMQEGVDRESAVVAGLELLRAEVETAPQQAETRLADARLAVEDIAGILEEASSVLCRKREILAKAELEKQSGDVELEQVRSRVSDLETVLSGSFRQLREVEWESEADAAALLQAVLVISSEVAMEESLALALPTSLAKRDRGAFDVVVVSEFDSFLREKIAALSREALTVAASVDSQTISLQNVCDELDQASATHARATEELSCAHDAVAAAELVLHIAKDRLTDFKSDAERAGRAFDAKRVEMEDFCAYHVCIFKMLRDRMSSKMQVEEAAHAAGA